MEEFYKDPVADRLLAFADLAITLEEVTDERVRELGYEMLENTVRSIEIPRPQSATVLEVVKG